MLPKVKPDPTKHYHRQVKINSASSRESFLWHNTGEKKSRIRNLTIEYHFAKWPTVSQGNKAEKREREPHS